MANAPRKSGRVRVPSKRARGALSSSSEEEEDDQDDECQETPTPPDAATATPPDNTSPAAAGIRPSTAREKFNERYKTASNSAEKVLELQMKQWSSAAYQHFLLPPEISREGGWIRYVFKCKAHPSVTVNRARHDDSTSNLNRHVSSCAPANNSQSKAMEEYASGSTYNETKHRVKIALWIARRRRPYLIAEDPELLDIFRCLNASCVTPSRTTVSRDVQEIHQLTKKVVIEILSSVKGKIHVSGDGWSTPNAIAFLGIIAHFIQNGKLQSLVLDFVKITQAHTGAHLARQIANCLEDFQIEKKVGTFTGDNAANNNTLVKELEVILPSFGGEKMQVRCFAHTLNLVAKAILSPFAVTPTKRVKNKEDDEAMSEDEDGSTPEDELCEQELRELDEEDGGEVGDEDLNEDDEFGDEIEDDEIAPDVQAQDAAIVANIAAEANLDGRVPKLPTSVRVASATTITKLKKLAFKISNSPTLIHELYEMCAKVSIPPRRPSKDVPTRWNSTAELVMSGIALRPALDRLVTMAEFNKAGGVRLGRYRLSSSDWETLEALQPMLDFLMFATKEISKSKTPLIHDVIPLIDSLTATFDEVIDDMSLPLTVRHAALRGVILLNKYYAKTDDSIVYRIAMILHPRHKTTYFDKAKWEDEWITTAKDIIKKEWKDHYKVTPSASAQDSTTEALSSDRFSKARRHYNNFRDQGVASSTSDPLEDWIGSPPVVTNADPIVFWLGMLSTGHPLAQMALDFLSVPATSTDVERAFSRGGLTVSKLRHNLSDKSVRSATVLGMWAEHEGIVPFDDIVAVFADKRRRGKGKGKAASASQPTNVIAIDN